jgi:tetratricopeptide (TPR) repeat protein
VSSVLDRIDAPSNAVRKAARDAWAAYVTGPPPPPAPKDFRKLPGGKKSDEKLPLYLTYRELAEQELRRVLLAQTGKEPDASLDAEAMTRKLLDLYDQRRAEKGDAVLRDAAALATQGKWEEVGARYDALLLADPLYAHRAQMAPGYLELGRALAKRGERDKARLAFRKAVDLDPEGPGAAGGRTALEALRVRPETQLFSPPVQPTTARVAAPPPRDWMLYAGLGGGALGLLLTAAGLLRRRRP